MLFVFFTERNLPGHKTTSLSCQSLHTQMREVKEKVQPTNLIFFLLLPPNEIQQGISLCTKFV